MRRITNIVVAIILLVCGTNANAQSASMFIQSKGTGWTPAQDADLQLWSDPSRLGTISDTGGLVDSIQDLSVNGYTLTATGTTRPTTGSRTIFGRNVLDYDGGDYLTNASFTVPSSGDMTIVWVGLIDPGGVDNASDSFVSMDATNDFQFDAGNASAFDGVVDTSGIGSGMAYSDPPHDKLSVYAIQFDYTGVGAYKGYVNGVKYGNNTTYSTKLDTSQALKIMSNRVAAQFLNGIVGELIITGDATNDTRLKYTGYLAWKWSLQERLAEGHTYRFDGRLFGYQKLWTPAEIATAAWYDAMDLDTITESGGAVSGWDDKSGNNNDLTQGTGVYQPTWEAKAWDDIHPSIDFDGVAAEGDSLSIASFLGTSSTEWAVFAVLDQRSSAKTRQSVIGSGAPMSIYTKTSATYPGIGYDDDTISYYGETGAFQTGKQVLTWIIEDDGDFYRDGTAVTSGTWTPAGYSFTSNSFAVGLSGSQELEAEIGEIIVVRRAVATEAIRQKLEGYLAWKWRLDGDLDASHPYKDAAPRSL